MCVELHRINLQVQCELACVRYLMKGDCQTINDPIVRIFNFDDLSVIGILFGDVDILELCKIARGSTDPNRRLHPSSGELLLGSCCQFEINHIQRV